MLRYLSGQENRWPWSRYVCPAVSGDSATISLESGNVYPCLFFETFPDTQIGHQEDLVLKHQFSEVSLQENLQGQCKDCFYKPFCLGGCRAVAYSFAKFFGTKNPLFAGQDYCLTRQLDKELDDSDV
jgi:radical SAM protein with 4Fe4S-binding SPASM domain